ncbi:MAG: nitrite reductase [Nitrospirae bacterium YQR-1]
MFFKYFVAVVIVIVLLPVSALCGDGEEYNKYCSQCHGADRLGKTASPLLPPLLKKYSDQALTKVIREGLPATQMPSFPDTSDAEVKNIISFVRSPATVKWDKSDILQSITLNKTEINPVSIEQFKKIVDKKNITAVVERGRNKVWIMYNDRAFDWFDFQNVHGGGKFSTDGKMFFIPSRDGWIGKYNLTDERYYGKVRACVNLRNISLSRDGKYILAACLMPQQIEILSAADLSPVKTLEVPGRINAIYETYSDDKALFTINEKPLIGKLNTIDFKIDYTTVECTFDDFFIDPLERYVVGTSRGKKLVIVYDLHTEKEVYRREMESMPHLAPAAFWYSGGDFYFATPHISKPTISVWKMYNWDMVKEIEIGGEGFFVKTTPKTPYLWIDNGSDKLVLLNKKDFSMREITPLKGKKATHTEFTGDGSIAMVSVFDPDGELVFYDSATLKELKRVKAVLPVGKYNFVHKSRSYEKFQLGQEVFNVKCWGCHHTTREAFGPSFKWIVNNRDEGKIVAHIVDPEKSAKEQYSKTSAMPHLNLKKEELEVILRFMYEFKDN